MLFCWVAKDLRSWIAVYEKVKEPDRLDQWGELDAWKRMEVAGWTQLCGEEMPQKKDIGENLDRDAPDVAAAELLVQNVSQNTAEKRQGELDEAVEGLGRTSVQE